MEVFRKEITDAEASAFANSEQIPEKYVRTEEVLDGVVVGADESYELPVVDMARLLDPELSASETAKLGDACRNWGFFQLTNHEVDEAVVQRMKDNTVHFFSLPLESKAKVAVRGNGFEGFGHHLSSKVPYGKLDWAESMILTTQPVQDRNMEMWPVDPPTFRDALEVYSVEMIDLTVRLLPFMAADLGVEQEALQDSFTGKGQSMAIHYYPPCRHREKVMGTAAHTDGSGLTLLLHVDDTPGLQIRKDDGRWYPVHPLRGALVVFVGNILEVLTNGTYPSVEHRVIPDAERGRNTVAIFQGASVRGLVTPLPDLLKEGGTEARFRSIEIEEYKKGDFSTRWSKGGSARFNKSLRI